MKGKLLMMTANLREIKERIVAKTLEKVIGGYTNQKIVQLNQEIFNTYQTEVRKIEKLFDNIEKDLNFREEGKTPLYTAIKEGYKELVDYLINNGADLNNINEENQAAFDLIHQEISGASVDNSIFPQVEWNEPKIDPIGQNPDYLIITNH